MFMYLWCIWKSGLQRKRKRQGASQAVIGWNRQPRARSQDLYVSFLHGWPRLNPWVIFHCCPSHISRCLDLKWSSTCWSRHSHGIPGRLLNLIFCNARPHLGDFFHNECQGYLITFNLISISKQWIYRKSWQWLGLH